MQKLNFGESDKAEFKEKPANLEKEIVAFANAKGGTIYIGVRDDGTVRGFKLDNRSNSQIVNSIHNCEPMPEFSLKEVGDIVELEILEGNDKPYRAPDGFYKRYGATSQKLNRDQIFEIAIKENKVRFDGQILKWVINQPETLADLFDTVKFTRYRELTGIDGQISNVSLLSNLGLIDTKSRAGQIGVTNALVLLFSTDVPGFFPQAKVICWLMKDEVTILKQFVIEGDLFHQLNESILFLESYLQNSFKISDTKRSETPELPKAVLREIVLNALIHRNYFEAGAEVQIKLYPNQLTVANPCSLGMDLEIDKLFGNSLRPNPLLAEVFERAGFIERAGTGLLRVNQLLTSQHLPKLKISIDGSFFVVRVSRQMVQTTLKEYSKWQKAMVDLLNYSATPKTSAELAEHLGISTRAVRNELVLLIQRKVVERIKRGRSLTYRLVAEIP